MWDPFLMSAVSARNLTANLSGGRFLGVYRKRCLSELGVELPRELSNRSLQGGREEAMVARIGKKAPTARVGGALFEG